MKKHKLKITLMLLTGVILSMGGFRCNFITPAEQQALQPIELTWWGAEDEPGVYNEVINDYRAMHPHITVTYRKLRKEEFEKELLNALAEDRGPDIFTIENTWITKYLPKIEPIPEKTKVAYQYLQKTLNIKEETITEIRENISFTPLQVKDGFLDAVYNDVVRNEKIYGLPLSMDTLVMFYNRDLLNNAGIPLPPTNWLSLQQNVKTLTYQDKNGALIQSGAALGTGTNIAYSTDILSLLMMQNGARMTIGGQVTFGLVPEDINIKNYNPGPEAIRFYTDFSNPSREVYTWNDTFPSSLDAFAQGRVAMVFGYFSDINYLEAKRSGKLNYVAAKVPQIEGRPEVNFARYTVNTVSKKSKNINEAWDFVQFITKKAEAQKYLKTTGKPTALRSLVADQQASDKLKVFADQLLTGRSWYTGKDVEAMYQNFNLMIEMVRKGQTLKDAVDLAVQKVQQTY